MSTASPSLRVAHAAGSFFPLHRVLSLVVTVVVVAVMVVVVCVVCVVVVVCVVCVVVVCVVTVVAVLVVVTVVAVLVVVVVVDAGALVGSTHVSHSAGQLFDTSIAQYFAMTSAVLLCAMM